MRRAGGAYGETPSSARRAVSSDGSDRWISALRSEPAVGSSMHGPGTDTGALNGMVAVARRSGTVSLEHRYDDSIHAFVDRIERYDVPSKDRAVVQK